jgi:hypothetical protein
MLLALWDSMKKLPELIQRRSQHDLIERTGRNLKHGYINDLVDDHRINHDDMPHNSRLKDNAIVLILHYLYMSIKLSDQPSEHNVGAVVGVAQ